MNTKRDWTVLLIGGASGSGKSSVAYELSRIHNVNVIEVDDIFEAIKSMTTRELHPAIHYWSTGINWIDIGVSGNVKWLIDVSKEMITGLKSIVENHIEADVPVIIEGDFIHPELALSIENPKVKSLFINESDKIQIVQNYLDREGGELQHFRADISTQYGKWLEKECISLGIPLIESRPWDTIIQRLMKCI